MFNLPRRQWLKWSALGTTAALVDPTQLTTPLSFGQKSDSSAPVVIRLSANENPYGPSERMRQAMSEAYDRACRYPYSWYAELVGMLAEKHGVSPQHIMLTAGSTEGLKMAGITYGGPGTNIVAAEPVFLALLRYAEQFGTYIHRVPVLADGTHDLPAMEQRLTQSTRLVYVCNPNNPTGALQPAADLRQFCEAISHRSMVFADEAYFDYITEPNYPSMTELVRAGGNVIVARTFSKVYGLAGLRIGYLVARPDIIERIGRSVMSGPNMLAVAAAKAALEDEEFYRFSVAKAFEGRRKVTDTLDELGLSYVPPATNFVFFKTGRNIVDVQRAYLAQGVQVGRPFPPLTDWCRVSMGTVEQVDALCAATRRVFG